MTQRTSDSSRQGKAKNAPQVPHVAPPGDSAAGSAAISGGSGVAGSAGSASGISSQSGDARQRSKFDAFELATVLSHYDLGVIESIQEFPRGSRKAPKLLIKANTGPYLLKRRASGKDDPYKVAFCHAIQLHLADAQFPLPHLIGTKHDNNSMLQLGGRIYEMFEYIKGTPYDNSLEATGDSGRILALFHKLLADYNPEYATPRGSYHHARSVLSAMSSIPRTFTSLDPRYADQHATEIRSVVRFLEEHYRLAAETVEALGMIDWPKQIIHSDWHPGNMLFRGSRVVAVIDYDAARIQPRIVDVANGALQFAILGGAEDPATWPEYLDEGRLKRFIRGNDAVPGAVLSRAELRCLPWLMMEALIAEAVIPIAATGAFARMDGLPFLQMVQRKVTWLKDNAERLVESLDS